MDTWTLSTHQLHAMNEARQHELLFGGAVDQLSDACTGLGSIDSRHRADARTPLTAAETSRVVDDLAALELAETSQAAPQRRDHTPSQHAWHIASTLTPSMAMKSSEDLVRGIGTFRVCISPSHLCLLLAT
jgi:hypothetical protein